MSNNSKDSLVPFAFSGKGNLTGQEKIILAGDVGGTKTNLAFYRTNAGELIKLSTATYASGDYNSVTEMLQKFMDETNESPQTICLGVAGPVINGKVELTNLDWDLNINDIRKQTGIQKVSLLNDLESTAYGLAGMKENDFITIHEGKHRAGNMAIIAPGTGLGEAGLYWDGAAYHPFPTEGGHCDFSPRTEFDIELYWYLQEKYGIVSWEKLISGPAIYDIYQFLRDRKNMEEPSWLREAFSEDDPSAQISEAAIDEKASICIETMSHFVRYLARESSNLVLKMKAIGGLFLSGGIPPKIAALLNKESFFDDYMDCDRMQHLLKDVPIKIITNERAPMMGAAYYGAFGNEL